MTNKGVRKGAGDTLHVVRLEAPTEGIGGGHRVYRRAIPYEDDTRRISQTAAPIWMAHFVSATPPSAALVHGYFCEGEWRGALGAMPRSRVGISIDRTAILGARGKCLPIRIGQKLLSAGLISALPPPRRL